MRIASVVFAPAEGAFTNDDQAAIRAGARRNGFAYDGAPVTPGFRAIRQPAVGLAVILVLEDGAVSHGDAVAVQYAGAAGRDPLWTSAELTERHGARLARELVGAEVASFRAASERLDALDLPVALRYGASQALLGAAAHSTRRTAAEVVADEYRTGSALAAVPVFAQSGEDRRGAIDRMVIRAVEVLPHGLINNARELVGDDGETFLAYVRWVRDRILELRASDGYEPTLHFDTYGTLGEAFPRVPELARYLARLGETAAPFRLRVEHPLDAGSRQGQIDALRALRTALAAEASDVQVVADEWCNTLADVEEFARAGSADMIQVKTPDLGSLDESIRALVACREAGVGAYCGGSCTDTDRAGVLSAGVAMGVGADQLLARPGMGVDEAVMVVRNEMARTRALIGARAA